MSDDVAPPFVTALSAMFVMTFAMVFGRIRDVFWFLLRPHTLGRGKPGYAPVRDRTEDFYMRRMYGRIVDCYNRPIASAPDAWVDVMERHRVRDHNGMDVALIEPTGATRRCLNLSSYNYLGFAASDPYCTPRVQDTIAELGVSTCSPRVVAGTQTVHEELEELVAQYLGVEAAITYGMGFATNSSTIPALVGKGCLILSDSLNHSSIAAGSRLSGAKIKVFRHNDARHLEGLLRESIAEGQPRTHRPWKKVLVIVEGVYSMEGETCNLREVVQVAKRYKAYVYLDEAHSIGALGPTGRGCCEHWGVDPRDVDVMMGTFTKSFGSCGGYIAGRKPIIDFLRRHSPAHLYACAMAPGCVQQVTSALQVVMGLDGTARGATKVRELHDNSNYVRSRLLCMGLDVLGSWDSPVMPIMTYNPAVMVGLSRMALARNMAMVIVGFPATPLLLTRARICVSAAHTREDLQWAVEQLEEIADLCLMRYYNAGLYARAEASLKDHFARHYGPEAGAAVTIKGLASGEFDLEKYRAPLAAGLTRASSKRAPGPQQQQQQGEAAAVEAAGAGAAAEAEGGEGGKEAAQGGAAKRARTAKPAAANGKTASGGGGKGANGAAKGYTPNGAVHAKAYVVRAAAAVAAK